MSPAFYAIGIKDAIDATYKAMQVVDPECNMFAFLDDTYMMGTPAAPLVGFNTYKVELWKLGLTLNEPKTKLLVPEDPVPISAIPHNYKVTSRTSSRR